MAIAILADPPWPGCELTDVEPASDILTEDGPGEERVFTACPIKQRRYVWPLTRAVEDLRMIEAFHRARALAVEAFYLIDPVLSWRYDVSVGPAIAAQTVYTLPTSLAKDEYRGFPIAGTVSATLAGTPRPVTAVDTDGRLVTLGGALPGGGEAVLLSYQEYRLCRFASTVRWSAPDADWWNVGMEIREVWRRLGTVG